MNLAVSGQELTRVDSSLVVTDTSSANILANLNRMNALTDNLEQLKQELKPHFKPGFLQQNSVVFQFQFEVGAAFHLSVQKGDFQFTAGEHQQPTITLFLDCHDTAHLLLTGTLDGMQAFMEGKYRADGNIVLSQLLLYLFKPDDPTSIYQVRD